MSLPRIGVLVFAGIFVSAASVAAQPIGTFRWQIQPYCNLITVHVVQTPSGYTLDGTDDRCGASTGVASVVGFAFLNPSGNVGFGLMSVLPGGTPVHTEATINISTLNGTWRDSGGNSGSFVFTAGPGIGGSPRPVPSGGIAPASVTTIQLAPAAVQPGQVGANAVTGANIADASLTSADVLDAPRLASTPSANDEIPVNDVTDTVIRSVTINAAAAGKVIVFAGGYIRFNDAAVAEFGRCSITSGTTLDLTYLMPISEGTVNALVGIPFSGSRVFNVPAGSTTFRLVCDRFGGGNVVVGDGNIAALYIAQ